MDRLGLIFLLYVFSFDPLLAGGLKDTPFDLDGYERAAIRHKQFYRVAHEDARIVALGYVVDRIGRKIKRLKRSGKVSRSKVLEGVRYKIHKMISNILEIRRRQIMGFVTPGDFDLDDDVTIHDLRKIKRLFQLHQRLLPFKDIPNAGDFVGLPHTYVLSPKVHVGVLEKDGVSRHKDLQACRVHGNCVQPGGNGHGAMVTSLGQQILSWEGCRPLVGVTMKAV